MSKNVRWVSLALLPILPLDLISHLERHSLQALRCLKSIRIWSFSGPSGPTEIFRISPYSVRMPEKFDQKNSKYRHFSRNDRFLFCHLKENKFKHNFQDSVSSSFWNWRKFWTFLTKKTPSTLFLIPSILFFECHFFYMSFDTNEDCLIFSVVFEILICKHIFKFPV